jgi:hypothetical protein
VVRSDVRDRIRVALNTEGIATRIYYEAPLHLLPALRRYGAGVGSLPVSEDLCRSLLALPSIRSSTTPPSTASRTRCFAPLRGAPGASRLHHRLEAAVDHPRHAE